MKIHSLVVTQTHINKGIPNDSKQCPVTLALWEYFGDRYKEIETLAEKVYLYKNNGRQLAVFKPNYDLKTFITDFDAGKKVRPRTFRLELELKDEDL